MALAASALENQTLPGGSLMFFRSRNQPGLPRTGVERIFVRGTNWLGDVIMSLPALWSLRRAFPDAWLAVLAKPWVADLYRLCPAVDEVIIYESPGRHDGLRGMLRLCRELQEKRFQLAVLLQNAFEAAFIATMARIPLKAGYASDGRGFLLSHPVTRTKIIREKHQRDYYLYLMTEMGVPPSWPAGLISIDEEAGKACYDQFIDKDMRPRPLVGLAVGAEYGPAKRWYPERFAALADRLVEEEGAGIVLLGSPRDREQASRVADLARHPLVNLAGKTSLLEVTALISHLALLVANDSGLMHVAGALDVPVAAIFGSTNPRATSPLGTRGEVIYKGVTCSPCLKTHCPTDFRCMEMISADEVYHVARRLLAKGDKRSSLP
jgi:heptosyltransferase-2